jgi:hypothetical protein
MFRNLILDRCKPLLILRLYGGIGNQLFSYAAALRLSLYNQVPLYIDTQSGFIKDSIYKRKYRLNAFEITSKRSFWAEIYCFVLLAVRKITNSNGVDELLENRIWIQQEKIEFDKRILTVKITHPVVFEGYWQSENYFSDIESRVRREFTFLNKYQDSVAKIVENISLESAVAVHVRHFNNSNHPNKGNIHDGYYIKAIKYFTDLIPNVSFYIFSDKPMEVRSKLFGNNLNTFLVSDYFNDNDEVKELCLMSKFKYFIIGNSTFSWWGAWLSKEPEKIVLVSDEKIISGEGSWGFHGLIPEKWIKI